MVEYVDDVREVKLRQPKKLHLSGSQSSSAPMKSGQSVLRPPTSAPSYSPEVASIMLGDAAHLYAECALPPFAGRTCDIADGEERFIIARAAGRDTRWNSLLQSRKRMPSPCGTSH